MSLIKQIGLLVLVGLLMGGGWAAYDKYYAASEQAGGGPGGPGGRGGAGATAVDTARAERKRLEDRIEAVGTTLARQAVEIVPMASGRVVGMNIETGDRVSEGDVLVRLDDDIQRADLAEAEAKLSEARLALERARTLGRTNTVSAASIEQLTAALATAQAQVDRATRRLQDRSVKAPFDGVLGLNRVEVGSRVSEGTVITTLDDLSQIEIEFALPETVFGQVRPGLDAKADAAAFPGRVFTGSISSIDSRIDAVSRSFKVRAQLPNEDLTLPAGMFMHLLVVLDTRDALTIPEEAIVAEGNETSVFVVADGKAQKRTVALGAREFGIVEVVGGLETGEKVVTRGVHRLRDGASVREPGAGGPDRGRRDGEDSPAAVGGSPPPGGAPGADVGPPRRQRAGQSAGAGGA